MQILPQEIAFDFDGVVADTFHLFTRIAKSDYGIDIDYESITHYEFLRSIQMDRAIAESIIEAITFHSHELDLRPHTRSLDVLERLADVNPLLFVTARPESAPVSLWFERHLPGKDLTIIATGDNTAKLAVLEAHHIRYFIDDRLDTCHQLASAGITPIVYAQPWNRQEHPFTMVQGWDEIEDLIDWNGHPRPKGAVRV